jgi:hypothetical protein
MLGTTLNIGGNDKTANGFLWLRVSTRRDFVDLSRLSVKTRLGRSLRGFVLIHMNRLYFKVFGSRNCTDGTPSPIMSSLKQDDIASVDSLVRAKGVFSAAEIAIGRRMRIFDSCPNGQCLGSSKDNAGSLKLTC